jgi:hypothetical protein
LVRPARGSAGRTTSSRADRWAPHPSYPPRVRNVMSSVAGSPPHSCVALCTTSPSTVGGLPRQALCPVGRRGLRRRRPPEIREVAFRTPAGPHGSGTPSCGLRRTRLHRAAEAPGQPSLRATPSRRWRSSPRPRQPPWGPSSHVPRRQPRLVNSLAMPGGTGAVLPLSQVQIALVAPPWLPEGETSSEGADKADRGAIPCPDGGR